MFAGVLVAAVLHGALLIGVHELFDLRFEDYTRPLTVQLLAPEARDATVREQRPLPPKQAKTAPTVAVPKPAPQPVATPLPAARVQPAPERATAQEPAPVRTQPRTESAPAEAPAGPVAAWTPALRQSVESAPVRGRGGLNAVTGDTVRQAEPRTGAAASDAAPFTAQDAAQDDLPTTFKDGLALPVDDSVYARSAASRTPGASGAQGVGSDNSVPVVRDPGLSGRSRDASAPLAPVRMSGTPTARRGDAAGGTEPAAPLADSAPRVEAKPAPVDATVYGGAAAPSGEAADVGSRIPDLDRALRASGRDRTASAGADRGASTAADGAAGPAVADARLPEGWNVSGPLGQRRLLNVVDPALPKRYPAEIVRSTVRVIIRVEPEGWVTVERFEQDSGSTELNNEIRKALRQWRYEPVRSQDPVYGEVTIQIRTRSDEVAGGR